MKNFVRFDLIVVCVCVCVFDVSNLDSHNHGSCYQK